MKNKKDTFNIIISFVIVFCIIGLAIYSAYNKPERLNNQQNSIDLNNNINQQQIINNEEILNNLLPQNIKNMDTQEKVSKNGDTLVMNYTGRLEDGTIFDSNVLPEFMHVEPFEFTLGAGQVIAGWDEGLVGMKVGEKKTLTISPEKGYGNRAIGSIPANSTLIFDVELLEIK